MNQMPYEKELAHYFDNFWVPSGQPTLNDKIDEAIGILLVYFDHMDTKILLHYSRQLAIPYLALCEAKRALISQKHFSTAHWIHSIDRSKSTCTHCGIYVCNEKDESGKYVFYDYCPNCGAKILQNNI